ncbi:hypothetical protein BT93_I0535 [Corymbia citriodora subsp. variegata]|nr:hypothetical protein BT93_I0535 [Corymbia citriodora subsp. variegata]
MGSAARARRRSGTTGCSIVAVLLMTLLLAESGAAHGRALSSETSKQEVTSFNARGGVKSAVLPAPGADQHDSNRALPTDRVSTMASGPSRKGPGH